MAAVFDSAIDRAFLAASEAPDAEAEVALLAAVALLDDFARSACSLLTCFSRSAIRASMGLRSEQPAVIINKAKMEAFAIVIPHSMSKADRTMMECRARQFRNTVDFLPIASEQRRCLLENDSTKTAVENTKKFAKVYAKVSRPKVTVVRRCRIKVDQLPPDRRLFVRAALSKKSTWTASYGNITPPSGAFSNKRAWAVGVFHHS
jgi:hypothetical protein